MDSGKYLLFCRDSQQYLFNYYLFSFFKGGPMNNPLMVLAVVLMLIVSWIGVSMMRRVK